MGRKPIGEKAMTAAERQARVRELQATSYTWRMNEMQAELDAIELIAWKWHKRVKTRGPAQAAADVGGEADAFADIASRVAGLSLMVGAA